MFKIYLITFHFFKIKYVYENMPDGNVLSPGPENFHPMIEHSLYKQDGICILEV